MLAPYRFALVFFGICGLLNLPGCGPVNLNPHEVGSASSGTLCGVLNGRPGPTLSTRRAIDHELARRGKRCFGKVVINKPPEQPPANAGGGGVAQAKPPAGGSGGASAPAPRIKGTGTAFVVNGQGNLVTNHHVVSRCDEVYVWSGKKLFPAIVIASDPGNDIAVVEAPDLPVRKIAKFRNDGPQLGEDIMVAGFPYATMLGGSLKTTFGNVSSVIGLENNASDLQLSAPIQPGNSGGPIVDQSGAVIGVVTSSINNEYLLSGGGDIGQLMNFGVKSDVVVVFLKSHRIPMEIVSAGEVMRNAQLAADALDYTFLFVCA